MSPKSTRRSFLKVGPASAAALAALAHARTRDRAAAAAAADDPAGPTAYLCVTCGTQFAPSARPPERCPVCEDERQYVGPDGQEWTTLGDLRKTHKNVIKAEEPGLHSINATPKLNIGQRAFLIRTPAGNVLWDCVGLLDDPTVDRVKGLGGVAEIAISHPHYYTCMVEWSRAFGDAPVRLHEADRPWVMRPDPCVEFWSGESLDLIGGLRLVHTGGHFEGFQVLHWPAGAGGRGVLMAGDQPQVCMDPKQVSFMYSYPNFIPLNAPAIRRVKDCLDPLAYDRLYGAFVTRGKGVIPEGAKAVVGKSVDRYLRAIQS